MSKSANLIYPHQLFEHSPALKKDSKVYLIEDALFFKQFKFHQQKLVLHRASMKFYEQFLIKKGFEVVYVNHDDTNSHCAQLIKTLSKQGITHLNMVEVVDNWLMKKLKTAKPV